LRVHGGMTFLHPILCGAQSFKIVSWDWDEDEGPPFISELLPSSGKGIDS
jgi:hypothetical protein